MKKRSQVDIGNSGVLPRDGYTDVLAQITKGGFCPFCTENLAIHHTKPVLFKNKSWLVTENAWPYEGTTRHFLLITLRHTEDAAKLTSQEWSDLGSAQRKLVKKYDLPASTLVIRSGDTKYTGASVRHLHAQLVVGSPRTASSTPITVLAGFGKKKLPRPRARK